LEDLRLVIPLPRAMAPPSTPQLRALENGFAKRVEALMHALWDANVSERDLGQQWLTALKARKQVLGSMGVESGQAMSADHVNWKGLLLQVAQRKHKRDVKLTFEMPEMPEGHPGPHVARVSCDDFQSIYEGEPAVSKKKAEQSAAQQALAYEFPAEFEALSNSPSAPGTDNLSVALGNGAPGGPASKKRKLSAEDPSQVQNAKCRLQVAVIALLSPKAPEKGDVVYDTNAVEGQDPPGFVSTVCIPAVSDQVHYGEMCASKKLAENSAAEAVLNSDLAPEIARLEGLQAEKKAEKNRVALAALKEKYAEKKLAAKAGAEAQSQS